MPSTCPTARPSPSCGSTEPHRRRPGRPVRAPPVGPARTPSSAAPSWTSTRRGACRAAARPSSGWRRWPMRSRHATRLATRAARVDLHGALVVGNDVALAPDVAEAAAAAALTAVGAAPPAGASLVAVRVAVSRSIRRLASLRRDEVAPGATAVVDELVRAGRLVRAGDRVRLPGAPDAGAGSRPGGGDGPPGTVARGRDPAGALGRSQRGCVSARRDPRARAQRPDRRPGARPRIRDVGVPGSRGAGAGPLRGGATDAGRLSRRDRHEPQVRHGDPRGPRSTGHPAPDRRRGMCPGRGRRAGRDPA